MTGRAMWRVYRAARRVLLPSLSPGERAEMDELIQARLRGAGTTARGPLTVWAREVLDLLGAALRSATGIGRGTRGGGDTSAWIGDTRGAVRSLARRPGFALGVAATLGLGIGATTTIYSVVDGVMLEPLPYEDARRLVAVGALAPGRDWVDPQTGLHDLSMISMPNWHDFEERVRSLDRLAAIEPNRTVVPGPDGSPELMGYARVSPGMLEMLGVRPELGRLFSGDEYGPGSPEVAIVSHGLWQRQLAGDPAAVGGPIMPGGDMTVVGVLPPDFRPPEAYFPDGVVPDLWVPIQDDPTTSPSWYERRRGRLYLLGRLAPGASLETARAEAAAVASELASIYPDDNVESDGSAVGIGMNTLLAETVGRTGRGLGLFLGAAVLLLLLASLNAATLLLARSLDRAREFGVRLAMGAGRARLVRLLMIEAVVLALLGGALGVALAFAGVEVFHRYAPASIPRLDAVAVDQRVLAAAGFVSLGAGVVAGLLPALRLTGRGPWQRLRAASRTNADSSTRLRGLLVGGQMAVAIVLLSGAALLFSSFVRMRTADPGFDPDGLVAVVVETKGGAGWDFQQQWIGWERLLEELGTVPGIESIGMATSVPFETPRWMPRLLMPDDPLEAVRDGIAGYAIMPGYHQTMRTRILAGRDFGPRDGPADERVALVNQAFVRTHLRGRDPIGLTIRWAAGTEWSPGDEWNPPREWLEGEPTSIRIVGLVEDVVQERVEQGPRSAFYVPYTQARGGPTAVIRTDRAPSEILPELRRAGARYNARVPLIDFAAVTERLAATQSLPRFQTLLVGAFAIVALLLAAAGLYGSLSHSVGRRQRELGVRLALGADRVGVLGLVLRQGMRLALAGLAVGMLVTLLCARLIGGFLYGVTPHDPLTLVLAGAALLTVAASACLLPARRATSVDPVQVLSAE